MADAEDIGLDKLVQIHAKIKAKIATFDAQIAKLEEQRTEVRIAIKDQMRALGLTSLNTSHGRVALMQKTRYSTNDWDSFRKFVLEHEVVELLEPRISQSNIVTFLEENPGVVPPGLNSFSDFEIRVTPVRK
jgi:hypothetical protein